LLDNHVIHLNSHANQRMLTENHSPQPRDIMNTHVDSRYCLVLSRSTVSPKFLRALVELRPTLCQTLEWTTNELSPVMGQWLVDWRLKVTRNHVICP